VHGLCRALAARGHDVTVFTTDTDLHGRVPTDRSVEIDGVNVRYFRVRGPRRLYWAPALRNALRRQIGGVDVVHLHSVFLWPTAAAAKAARDARVPYLLAPRGMLVMDLLHRRGALRKKLWLRLVERAALAGASALHVTSDLEADDARRLAGELRLPLPPMALLPNGVDEETDPADGILAPEVTAALARSPVALFLGRLSWKKGLDRLIAAIARVPSVTLVLAGGDEEGIRPRLQALARRAGVAERVIFLGAVEGADRAALLHRATIVALTSYSENFGNVVLEAMAAATPVLVTPEVGLAAEVRRLGAGIVAPGDAAGLASALQSLLDDSAARSEMGRRGLAAVRARYGWDRVAVAAEQIYAEQLRSAGRQPHAPTRLETGGSPLPIPSNHQL